LEWRNVLYTAAYEKNLLRDGFGVVWEIVFSKDFYRFRETGQGMPCPYKALWNRWLLYL